MAVDAARQHEPVGGVDDRGRIAEIAAERRDLAVTDSDIAGKGVGSGDDGAAAG
ncbi:hypothetical protein ACVWW1_001602 [Bradyrhizobium sp. JR3.5]